MAQSTGEGPDAAHIALACGVVAAAVVGGAALGVAAAAVVFEVLLAPLNSFAVKPRSPLGGLGSR